MKSDGEIMEILPAYDLTGSVRSAAVLVGCSHNTVAAHVPARDAGRAVGTPARSNSGTPAVTARAVTDSAPYRAVISRTRQASETLDPSGPVVRSQNVKT